MRTKSIIYFFNLIFICLNGMGQISNDKNSPKSKFLVEQLAFVKWNDQDGIPYKQVPGANLGATAFQIIDNNRFAFLCNSTSEIIITNNGKAKNKIPVVFAPRDFIYENGFFYVLCEKQVFVFDTSGKQRDQISFSSDYVGTERLARYKNETYLLLPTGNCVKIESEGKKIEPTEYEGWITSSGNLITTKLDGNGYSIKVITPNGNSFQKTFSTNKKVAGVFVVGSTEKKVILDVQTYISEGPIEVEREFVSIKLTKTGIDNIVVSQKALTCYYVLSNKEIDISPNGIIYNMVSAPDGLYVFSLSESKSKKKQNYPLLLQKVRYHYNYNLIKVD